MWYQNSRIIIAALEDTLANLAARGASEFILNRIRSSPPEYQGHYINQLMRNPMLSENDLITQVLTAVDKQKSNVFPPTMMEKNIANLFVPSQQQWALVYLKKLRTNPTANNPTYRSFENGNAEDQDYNLNTVFNQIADWARVSLREDPRFQLAAYDFNQALNLSNEWHNMMAGKGSDKFYRPYQRDDEGNIIDERVVYQFEDGWHISQLLDADDLTVEGNRMNHCVGGYCSEVMSGQSRIFSLRDPRNQPTVTIEMEGDSNTVKQIKANSDQVPEQELRYRLREWFGELEDGAQFKQSDYEWEGPEWYDSDTSSIRGNIYEEAYGREYYDYDEESSQDYHSDYGIDGEAPDWTRKVVDLDVSDLLDNVEEAMIGTRGRPGAFDRAGQYDNVDEVFEALADVIVAHDTEQINQILSPENSHLSHMRRLYDSSKDEWNLGKVRNYLGLFDIVEKYNDAYNEALEETELQKNGFGIVDVKDLVAESYKLELYYETLQQAISQISTEMSEQYKKIAGVDLVQDLQTNLGDNMKLVWHEYNEKVQPTLLRHRDSFPKGEEPRDEHGNIDESVFDENGWKYSKFKGWYRRA